MESEALDQQPVATMDAQNEYANDEYQPSYAQTAPEEEVKQPEQIVSSSPAQAEEPKAFAKPAVVLSPGEPTEAEKKLEEDANNAKNKLINEIKQFKVDDDILLKDGEAEPEDPRVQQFTVTNPVKVAGHVKYSVTGVDEGGEFTEVRRYREFHALGQVLRTRWPGCYIPSIPEKKLVKNNDENFVEERRSLLERFMKEIAKYDYIVFSKEFKVFARGKGEIDRVLLSLPKQTAMQVLEKYRLNFKIEED